MLDDAVSQPGKHQLDDPAVFADTHGTCHATAALQRMEAALQLHNHVIVLRLRHPGRHSNGNRSKFFRRLFHEDVDDFLVRIITQNREVGSNRRRYLLDLWLPGGTHFRNCRFGRLNTIDFCQRRFLNRHSSRHRCARTRPGTVVRLAGESVDCRRHGQIGILYMLQQCRQGIRYLAHQIDNRRTDINRPVEHLIDQVFHGPGKLTGCHCTDHPPAAFHRMQGASYFSQGIRVNGFVAPGRDQGGDFLQLLGRLLDEYLDNLGISIRIDDLQGSYRVVSTASRRLRRRCIGRFDDTCRLRLFRCWLRTGQLNLFIVSSLDFTGLRAGITQLFDTLFRNIDCPLAEIAIGNQFFNTILDAANGICERVQVFL